MDREAPSKSLRKSPSRVVKVSSGHAGDRPRNFNKPAELFSLKTRQYLQTTAKAAESLSPNKKQTSLQPLNSTSIVEQEFLDSRKLVVSALETPPRDTPLAEFYQHLFAENARNDTESCNYSDILAFPDLPGDIPFPTESRASLALKVLDDLFARLSSNRRFAQMIRSELHDCVYSSERSVDGEPIPYFKVVRRLKSENGLLAKREKAYAEKLHETMISGSLFPLTGYSEY
jgi:hypothetical protein